METNIYGDYGRYLPLILEDFSQRIQLENDKAKVETDYKLYEHIIGRIKTSDSMIEKCRRKQLPVTVDSALKAIRDSIGVRIICGFVNDIYQIVERIKSFDDCRIVVEKDYIQHVKPNGYRSYHVILEIDTPYPDCLGNSEGKYYIEIQLRTIAQDSWASLEHQMKYKHDIENPERIVRELKRCADEMASVDLTMQTIRQLIESGTKKE
ncbi:GTP pyrophosphokinase family protein [Streptococcus agalactiae]|uniref:GTP pyrophosphokinase n=1 Tax=Streptococcus agalactiae TaxID=1311 RepID=UPI000DCAD2B9|nr:GTP pyrophosphokinase family protein [Streptococcus agalactiae]AWZ32238.1 GTP pyrophosphokinase [Streptococcus agalactiae]KAF1103763.1 GTP pyrophosphokinase [Streptococcus agalactiae]KAF1134130.1 GTP pyrophosphokinase [Streptococcus agalactiae]